MNASCPSSITSPDDLSRLMGIAFSDQQIDAITAPMEPGVVVAGAGSGKTTVMAARVVWLVGTGAVAPDQVLGLTFTNKAAAELLHRVRHFLAASGLICQPPGTPVGGDEEGGATEPTVLTYHAYAARLLAEHGLRIGHEPDTRVIADASRFQLAARAIRQHTEPVAHLSTWVATSVTALLDLDAQLSEHLVSIDELEQFRRRESPQWLDTRQTTEVAKAIVTFEKRRELLGFIRSYRRLKDELGVMDFADQMARAATLAEASAEVGRIERDRFRIVLLDEYQDTSVAQSRLLRALFSGAAVEPAAAGVPDDSAVPTDSAGAEVPGRGHPVTAVGDPCQAIYGWRGASVANIDTFPTDFPTAWGRGEVVRYPLSVNRRSHERLLRTANTLATDLHASHVGAEPLQPQPAAAAGKVRAAVHETYDDELAFLAAEVPNTYRAMRRPLWSDIGVLVRDHRMASDVHDALSAAGVPVEVVGLSGLLAMPEVAEVVATLQVMHDVTANASLLSLLAGPRWAIGVRDLALLGTRARGLARQEHLMDSDIVGELERAVAGVDPADVASLLEALEDPGKGGYSEQARERFAALASELRMLRRHVGEPLLDLVRRVVDVTAIDVELAASTSAVATARRDNLSTFLDAVAHFAGIDNDASLPGLLAYLEAEEQYARGLALAVPSEANSVKLLTVHRAKGLEWDVVFVPGLCRGVFPSPRGRGRWPTAMQALPSPLRGDYAVLPKVCERSNKGLIEFTRECRAYDLLEERRLAYVALTRPREQLVVSCHWWGPEQKRPRGPSVFMDDVIESMKSWGHAPEMQVPAPEEGADNPADRALDRCPWPVEASALEVERRRVAAALVETAQGQGWRAAQAAADDDLLLDERAVVAQWDLELDRLVDEARNSRAGEVAVPLPATLSATAVLRLKDDPRGLARELARPMPRKPSAAARFGTRFHAWVESYVGQQQLLDPDELPGRADLDIASDEDLRMLTEAFTNGPFGGRTPYRVEAPFTIMFGGQVVRGRIDAVYETDTGYQVVDWKTSQAPAADPMQLAIYRLAWAEIMGASPEQVRAAFYYVRSGEVVEFDDADLPGRSALERLVLDGA